MPKAQIQSPRRLFVHLVIKEGLGLKSIWSIAEVAPQRQAWFIAAKRSSIWNNWAQAKYVKGRCFWTLKMPYNCAWGRRGILNSRALVLRHTQVIIGNGKETFLARSLDAKQNFEGPLWVGGSQ